ncbi:auxin-binding protein ABP19b-like [Chenopodium quinoa]|uniref:auxin-binding protein ABP19b-like n=1 Tax=Chenopodium quinoa TaxID=63459 RepID=UPI000B78EF13|nr:auxin-binding protein ABP19b-like [Chenopodium quinoa]
MNNIVVFFIFSFLLPLSYAIEFDFCVGDPTLPKSPNGYACKDPANVTIDDFVFTGFYENKVTTKNKYKSNVILAFADTFPALNGLGISKLKEEIDVGGVIPAHTHRTSEILVVIKGTILIGFIDTNNTAYYKRLKKGEVIVIPPTMIHFQVNVGPTPAIAYASFNGANPGIQVVSSALFASNVPADLIAKTTLLSPQEVKRMKLIFGSA